MHTYVKTLQEISSRYAPSRILSYDMAHIFKTLQLMHDKGHISREMLCKELNLGEGSIKTLVKHLKMQGMIHTSNSGTRLSDKGLDSFHSCMLLSLRNVPFQNALLHWANIITECY